MANTSLFFFDPHQLVGRRQTGAWSESPNTLELLQLVYLDQNAAWDPALLQLPPGGPRTHLLSCGPSGNANIVSDVTTSIPGSISWLIRIFHSEARNGKVQMAEWQMNLYAFLWEQETNKSPYTLVLQVYYEGLFNADEPHRLKCVWF